MSVNYVISTAERDEHIKQLYYLQTIVERVREKTKKSKKTRDSEKAMSLALHDRHIEAISMAMNALWGKVTVSPDPEIEAEDHV